MDTSQLLPEPLKPSHLLSYPPPPHPWVDGLWDDSTLVPPSPLLRWPTFLYPQLPNAVP